MVNLPIWLQELFCLACQKLSGCAPSHWTIQDTRGSGNGAYSVNATYATLLDQSSLPPQSSLWSRIWNLDGIPKINLFCWTLAHINILVGENLKKRGFLGPFRCALCRQEEESLDHLFLECPYSKAVWSILLGTLH